MLVINELGKGGGGEGGRGQRRMTLGTHVVWLWQAD